LKEKYDSQKAKEKENRRKVKEAAKRGTKTKKQETNENDGLLTDHFKKGKAGAGNEYLEVEYNKLQNEFDLLELSKSEIEAQLAKCMQELKKLKSENQNLRETNTFYQSKLNKNKYQDELLSRIKNEHAVKDYFKSLNREVISAKTFPDLVS